MAAIICDETQQTSRTFMTVQAAAENTYVDQVPPSGLESLIIVARQHGLHLTSTQLIKDNLLTDQEVTLDQLVRCAEKAGMRSKLVKLDWDGLSHLKKALPAIVCLRNGSYMVLLRVDGDTNNARIVLRDPNAAEDALLVIDRPRFEDIWSGDVVLAKRNYEISDESQPFSFGLVTALLFRERRIVRDVAIAALILGFLGLAPIMFWRLVLDKVVFYQAYNTFYVLCVSMVIIIAFEAAFSFLRQLLVHRLTTRLDVKLSTYVFEKVLNLPIDYFEQTAVGLVTRDIREVFRIRMFLMGQLFGTILDSTTLFFFLPIMFFFSPIMTLVVLALSGLVVVWLILMLPTYRKASSAVQAAEGAQGAFLIQTLNGIRTIKSLALDARQRHMWDVLVARVAKACLAEGMTANIIQAVVKPLERLTVSGSYAVGVYLALSTNDPVFIGALFAFVMLT